MTDVVPASVTEANVFQLQLQSIFLIDCSVLRGERGVDTEAGRVESQGNIEIWQSEDVVGYEVATTYSFLNEAYEPIVTISMKFAADYLKPPDSKYTDEQLHDFSTSVVFQVTPFQREFLATLTNRLAIAPFYLPLVRATDISVQTNLRDARPSAEPE
jgi:hypothetical protein